MEIQNPTEIWPPKTVLIIGDSMVNQINKERISDSLNKNIEVRSYGGASINSLYVKLEALLPKKPTTVILHIGTHDTTYSTAITVLNELLRMKHYIEKQDIEVIISCPIIRTDNKRAYSIIKDLRESIEKLKVFYILNTNIDETCLGKKGLHLNQRGVGRLAANLISLIRKL